MIFQLHLESDRRSQKNQRAKKDAVPGVVTISYSIYLLYDPIMHKWFNHFTNNSLPKTINLPCFPNNF